MTTTSPSRWLTVSTAFWSIVAFSVGEPSGSVTDQRTFRYDVSAGVNSALNSALP